MAPRSNYPSAFLITAHFFQRKSTAGNEAFSLAPVSLIHGDCFLLGKDSHVAQNAPAPEKGGQSRNDI
jgi:hypothetical protein